MDDAIAATAVAHHQLHLKSVTKQTHSHHKSRTTKMSSIAQPPPSTDFKRTRRIGGRQTATTSSSWAITHACFAVAIAIVSTMQMVDARSVLPNNGDAVKATGNDVEQTVRLALHVHIEHRAAIDSAVQLECPFAHPSWSHDSKDITTRKSRKTKTIRIAKIKSTDYGLYECRSDHQHWANLTLIPDDATIVPSTVDETNADYYLDPNEPESLSQNRVNDDDDNDDGAADDYDDDGDEDVEDSGTANETMRFNDASAPLLHVKAVGKTVSMLCPTLRNAATNITWTKDGGALGRSAKTNQTTLIVKELQPKDAGNYTCVLCNTKECANFTTQLRIKENDGVDSTPLPSANRQDDDLQEGPPSFVKFEKFNRLEARPSGNMVRLKCPAKGNPQPNITWTKDDKPICRSMGDVKKSGHYGIYLEDLVPKDSGSYTCKLCNTHGCIQFTSRVVVNERYPHRPVIQDGFPKNLTVRPNATVAFNCPVIADLEVFIQWAKYPAFNDSDAKAWENATNFKTDTDNPEILQLSSVTYDDEGWYTCIASNSLGHSAAKAYLRVTDKDPALAKIAPDAFIPIVSVTAFAVLLIVMTIAMVVQFRKYKHEKLMKHRAMETVHQWTKKIIIVKPDAQTVNPEIMQIPIVKIEKQRTTLVQQPSSSSDPNAFNEYEFPLDSTWEISRNQLTLGQTLGEGAFGRVVMAEAHGLPKGSPSLIVAVKMVKEGHTDTDMASLVREMEVMKMIGKHTNIINLLGCCSQDGPLYVIVEYAPHGNLKDFLKKHRHMSEFEVGMCHEPDRKEVLQKELISIAFQVARGMEYLASKRCIHRDLAARNVLVSEDFIVKIADFGLARDIQESEYYRKNTNGRLPIKWMAPESLRDKFYDTQSDVWSFGVLLWEIMTYGEQPYPQIFSSEHLYEFLREERRMEKPVRCSLNMYMMMRQCWNWQPKERPNFTEIVESLDQILSATINDEYLDLDIPLLKTPPSSEDENDDDDTDSDADTLHEQSLLRYQHR